MSYRSDLDLVFLHESGEDSGSEQTTNGQKPIETSVFFGRLVRRLVLFLTTQTGSGVLYGVGHSATAKRAVRASRNECRRV